MKGAGKPHAGAVRKAAHGNQVGTGGPGRKALKGKGPTPKAEDGAWHPAGKRKAARERYAAAAGGAAGGRSDGIRAPGGGGRRATAHDDTEIVTGRNSVVEALRAHIPATTLYLAARIEMDDRVK